MLDLNDLGFFVHVVDHGGLTAAAKTLGIGKSTLSQRLSRLEDELGVRLVQRTSRRFVVTDAGWDLHRHASAMLIEAETAESVVRERVAEPRGTVRLTCSVGMAKDLGPILSRFLERFPRINLVLHATNRYVDLVAEGFDVGLRGHDIPLRDSDLVMRRVARTPWIFLASPQYLSTHGMPRHPEDLQRHRCLVVSGRFGERTWRLLHDEEGEWQSELVPRLMSDDLDSVRHAALSHLGVALLPSYFCKADMRGSRLRPLLPGWTTGDAQVSLLTLPRRGRLPAVRALVESLLAEYPPLLGASREAPTFDEA